MADLRTSHENPSEVERSPEGADRLDELAWNLVPIDIVRSKEVALEALRLSGELGYERGRGGALVSLACHDFFMAAYGDALEKGKEARRLLSEDEIWTSRILLMEGLVFWSLGDFEGAVETLHRAASLSRVTADAELEAWALTTLGGVYEDLGDLVKAIGLHAQAFQIFQRTKNLVGVGRALAGLGNLYYRQGRMEAALDELRESLSLFRSVPSELSEARALNDIGVIHRARGNLEEAIDCLGRALDIRKKHGTLPAAITTTIQLGELHLDMGDLERAIALLNEAASLAERANAKPKLFRACEALSRAYERASDFQQALFHQRRCQKLREEVLSDEANARLKNLQIRFEVERAEREAEMERLRNVELKDALEQLKQTQAQLVQSEKMASLGKLVAGVAHEMNSPVGVITSSMDVQLRLLAKCEGRSLPELLEALRVNTENARKAGERLSEIVETLKSFSLVDRAVYQRFDVHESIESALALVIPRFSGSVRVVRRFGALPAIEGYPHAINESLLTLFANAGEAVGRDKTITIETEPAGDEIRLVVSDDGPGVPEDQIGQLFDVGFSRKGPQVRMHTGLANVHRTVVKLHGGSIDVESRPGEGTKFTITLPVRRERVSIETP